MLGTVQVDIQGLKGHICKYITDYGSATDFRCVTKALLLALKCLSTWIAWEAYFRKTIENVILLFILGGYYVKNGINFQRLL